MTINDERKPKTRAGKLYLERKEPKFVEHDKNTIFVRGQNANSVILNLLKDLYSFKKHSSKFLGKKNPIRPFENPVSLEFFSQKNDAALFFMGTHSKKRPNNLIIGRMFDFHVLDIYEFGMQNYVPLKDFQKSKIMEGSKPALIFNGLRFDSDPTFKRLKNLLIDVFRGPQIDALAINGIEHVISFTLCEDIDLISFRSFKLIKAGNNEPGDQCLDEIGPRMDMMYKRSNIASEELFKKSIKLPKQLKVKKTKNISYDEEGTKFARIHMKPQNLGGLKSRKIKGLQPNKIFKTKTQNINKMNERID
ncbi:unnamed protein product [Gordionus sp. m RMFG-2023]|uniref:ribosome production factor 2 homolog n=1 Tax=Gordionus sp. m RMFG-2023 TaxID=3053472 RepID=UPI0030E3478A